MTLTLLKKIIRALINADGIDVSENDIKIVSVKEQASFEVNDGTKCGTRYHIITVHYELDSMPVHDVFVITVPLEDTGLTCSVTHFGVDIVGRGPLTELGFTQDEVDEIAMKLLELAEKER